MILFDKIRFLGEKSFENREKAITLAAKSDSYSGGELTPVEVTAQGQPIKPQIPTKLPKPDCPNEIPTL